MSEQHGVVSSFQLTRVIALLIYGTHRYVEQLCQVCLCDDELCFVSTTTIRAFYLKYFAHSYCCSNISVGSGKKICLLCELLCRFDGKTRRKLNFFSYIFNFCFGKQTWLMYYRAVHLNEYEVNEIMSGLGSSLVFIQWFAKWNFTNAEKFLIKWWKTGCLVILFKYCPKNSQKLTLFLKQAHIWPFNKEFNKKTLNHKTILL